MITGLFIVDDLAGGGLVALPTAMIQSGYLGLYTVYTADSVLSDGIDDFSKITRMIMKNTTGFELPNIRYIN